MKVSKTENPFKTGFQQLKTGLPKTGINIPSLKQTDQILTQPVSGHTYCSK